MLFKLKFIISTYSQQIYFTRTENNFAPNINCKVHYICYSKNHKLKYTWISLHRINFKQIQHVSKIIFKIWKYMLYIFIARITLLYIEITHN